MLDRCSFFRDWTTLTFFALLCSVLALHVMTLFSFFRSKFPLTQTRVRSLHWSDSGPALVMLVSDSLTDWLTNWLPFSKLESDHCLPLSLTHWLTDWLAHSVAFLVIEFWALTRSLPHKDCYYEPILLITYYMRSYLHGHFHSNLKLAQLWRQRWMLHSKLDTGNKLSTQTPSSA